MLFLSYVYFSRLAFICLKKRFYSKESSKVISGIMAPIAALVVFRAFFGGRRDSPVISAGHLF